MLGVGDRKPAKDGVPKFPATVDEPEIEVALFNPIGKPSPESDCLCLILVPAPSRTEVHFIENNDIGLGFGNQP